MMMPADDGQERPRGEKGREAFRTISEVADELDLPQHVLRFWESKFTQIKPLKRGGNRRYYRPDDVQLLRAIKSLLHADGYTIKGVQKLFRAQGLKATVGQALGLEETDADMAIADIAADLPADVANDEPITDGVVADSDVRAPVGPTNGSKAQLNDLLAELKAIRARLGKKT